MVSVIEEKNNHLRKRECDCCGSVIQYSVNDISLHSSNEDGFGGDIWLSSIICPNCESMVLWDCTPIIENGEKNMKKHYGLGSLIFDFIMTIVTGGLWLVWILIRFLRANS